MRIVPLFVLPLLLGCPGKDKDSSNPTSDLDQDGYTTDEGDCDDSNPAVNPGEAEVYYSGIDEDCDAATDDTDQDADGYAVTDDCNDVDAAIHPDAEEVCDGEDNDCSGVADDGAAGITTGWTDADADGYGDPASPVTYCGELPTGVSDNDDDCNDGDVAYHPGAEESCDGTVDYNCDGSTGYADNDGDGYAACLECDDADGTVNPGAIEVCNDKDDNCDAVVDTDAVDQGTWYPDGDADGYGDDTLTAVVACDAPEGYTDIVGDCNDADPAYNPGAAESCSDPVDLNCDGSVGYEDADGDGVAACEDCDDGDAAVNPGATEVCDNVDNDCDGTVDAGAADAGTWYADTDADSYGDATSTAVACDPPTGFVGDDTDCDDGSALTNPDATEICDGADNDCNGLTDDDAVDQVMSYTDVDGDGYGDDATLTLACSGTGVGVGGDCDDGDLSAYPGASEACDGVDNDCDGVVDDGAPGYGNWYRDADGDGYGADATLVVGCSPGSGWVDVGGDCNDASAAVSPSQAEVCDGVDQDCDGTVDDDPTDGDVYYTDDDLDGYGDTDTFRACTQPADGSRNSADCDDTTATVNPSAAEVCDGRDNDCDGRSDEAGADGEVDWYQDADGDGYGNLAVTVFQCSAPRGYVASNTDCDDTDATVNPSVVDDIDYNDTDCDGWVDDDSLTEGDIVITEVVRQPRFGATSTQSNGMWFEVYNSTSYDIDLSNWYIVRESSTVAADAYFVDPADGVIVSPDSYVVLCKTDNYEGDTDASVPLYCDYYWGDETQASTYAGYYHDNTFNLQRDSDSLGLYVGTSTAGRLIDEVTWTYDATSGYWPRDAARSMALDPNHIDNVENDDVTWWCSTPTSGDSWWVDGTTKEYGSPGALNYDCVSGS